MALTLQQLMALKQAMAQKNAAASPVKPITQRAPMPPMAPPSSARYADGGEVSADELAPYMPTPQEEAASGYPPGPQRAMYIAQKKKNAADAAAMAKDSGQPLPPGYSEGGTADINKGFTDQDKKTFVAGMARGKKPDPTPTSYPIHKDNTVDDDAPSVPMADPSTGEKPITPDQYAATWAKMKAMPGSGYSDGGDVVAQQPASLTPEQIAVMKAQLDANLQNATKEDPTDSLQSIEQASQPEMSNPSDSSNQRTTDLLKQILVAKEAPKSDKAVAEEEDDDADSDGDDDSASDEQASAPAPKGKASISTKPASKQDDSDSDDDDSEDDEDENQGEVESGKDMRGPTPAQQDAVAALLSQLGLGKNGDDALKEAQAKQAAMLRNNALITGGQQIAAGFARGRGGNVAPDTIGAQQREQMAGLPVQNILQQRAATKDALTTGITASDLQDKVQGDDPNSNISKAARDVIADSFPNIANSPSFSSMTYSTIKGMAPMIDNVLTNQTRLESVKERMETARQNAALMAQNREAQRQQMQDAKLNAGEMKLGNAISQSYSQRGANGQAAKNEQLADRIIDLSNSFNPNDPKSVANARMTLNETIGMLAQAANGGIAHEGQVDKIYPKNISDSLAKLQTYLTSQPEGYDVKPFLDQAVNQAKIFKKVGQNYEKRNNAILLYGAKNSVRPEVYDHYKNQLGLEDDDINNAFSRTSDQTNKLSSGSNNAPAVGPHGASVVQNGHTYNWNPTTKQYE